MRQTPPKSPVKKHTWSEKEDRALIEFLDLSLLDENENSDPNSQWPMKNANSLFWVEAAKAIRKRTGSNILLSSNRVRNRSRLFRDKFNRSIEQAVTYFGLDTHNIISQPTRNKNAVTRGTQTKVKTKETGTQIAKHTDQDTQPLEECRTDVSVDTAFSMCKTLSPTALSALLMLLVPHIITLPIAPSFGDDLFSSVAVARNINTYPTDFFSKSIHAMNTLQDNNKPNLLYRFAQILSTNRPGTNIPLLQLDRMPFGLIQYQLEFYSSTNVHQVTIAPDYAVWLETMCSEFPTRFMRLFRGPGWSGVPKEDAKNPLKAQMNVAAPCIETMYRRAKKDKYDGSSSIQVTALEHFAKHKKPGTRVWFKADACDIKVALQTSVKGKWAGDVDLGDGSLQKLREDSDRRVACVKKAGKVPTRSQLEADVLKLLKDVEEDIVFLEDGLEVAQKKYTEKFRQPNSSTELLKGLAWERVEYHTLLVQAKTFYERYERLLAALDPSSPQPDRVAQCLVELAPDSQTYLQNLFKKRRVAADHAMVIMVSDERRNQKPYAVPIQLIPYHSLRDQFLQEFLNKCHEEAKKLGLTPVGDVTDGEFNSLRSLGNKRPIHLYEIIREVKDSVRRTTAQTILKSLRKVGEDDLGMPVTEVQDKAIPQAVIEEFHQLTTVHNMADEDAVIAAPPPSAQTHPSPSSTSSGPYSPPTDTDTD
ncbi:hypothetical protein Bbelb_235440 [Branchiostoma belcheri]|nr:hypothetical protein Bbelb_235440 [Branchiostoma belcheri]